MTFSKDVSRGRSTIVTNGYKLYNPTRCDYTKSYEINFTSESREL